MHDCLAEKTFKNSISLKSSLNDEGEKISDEYSMNKTSSSQNTIASGRKKRKAAPTNLTEPSLGRYFIIIIIIIIIIIDIITIRLIAQLLYCFKHYFSEN